jgi:hypothetical protein
MLNFYLKLRCFGLVFLQEIALDFQSTTEWNHQVLERSMPNTSHGANLAPW